MNQRPSETEDRGTENSFVSVCTAWDDVAQLLPRSKLLIEPNSAKVPKNTSLLLISFPLWILSVSFPFIPFHSLSSHFIPFHSISFHFIPFHSMSFHFIPFHSISAFNMTPVDNRLTNNKSSNSSPHHLLNIDQVADRSWPMPRPTMRQIPQYPFARIQSTWLIHFWYVLLLYCHISPHIATYCHILILSGWWMMMECLWIATDWQLLNGYCLNLCGFEIEACSSAKRWSFAASPPRVVP